MSWSAKEHDPEYPFDLVSVDFTLDSDHTALIIIDMQKDYLQIGSDAPLGKKHPKLAQYFNNRIKQVVMPNIIALVKAFQNRGLKIAYTRNGCMTSLGDELTDRLKALSNPPKMWRGTQPYEITQEIYPRKEDLVIDKLTSGAFTSTQLDHALRNYNVTDVIITGVYTDMCVLGSARVASELGYNTIICEDCCATLTQRAHDEALLIHVRRFGRVSTLKDIVGELKLA
ncbi:cysteine hydrolase family protein [Candidatus Latescibacterota bacterium]